MTEGGVDKIRDMHSMTEGSVDKIRDILFGGQMRDYDQRFRRLEEKLTDELTRINRDMQSRLESMDKFMRKELELKGRDLQQERKERLEQTQAIDNALQHLGKQLNERLSEVQTEQRQDLGELRQEIHDEISTLQNRLREQQDSLLKNLDEEASRLQHEKVSLTHLSGLFSEMGMRLSGQFSLPDGE